MKKIVLDALGGDATQTALVDGLLECLDLPFDFVLVGEEALLRPYLERKGAPIHRFEFIDAATTISNDEDPRELIKGREETSLVKAMLRVKEDDAVAYVSTGSTGAVLLGSIFRLGLIKGVKFPALGCFIYDIEGKKVCLLDCGANIDVQASLMPKFASLGSLFVKSYLGIENPRVGLLNIGKEEGKGNAFSKEAYKALKEADIRFVGNIEGNDILLGKADIVLTDGFAGNVALKAIEATALVCEEFAAKNGDVKTARQIDEHFHYSSRGASVVFGASKIVLKPHGSSGKEAIVASVKMIDEMEKGHLIEALRKGIEGR